MVTHCDCHWGQGRSSPCWGQAGTDPPVPCPCSDDVLELAIMPKDEDILQLVSVLGTGLCPGSPSVAVLVFLTTQTWGAALSLPMLLPRLG